MTQGIRAYVNHTFNETLPQLAELGNVEFRRSVMDQAILMFGIGVASAATHYNHALKMAKQDNPAAVAGLGRPEDKKGGRKKKVIIVDVAAPAEGEVTAPAVETTEAPTVETEAEPEPETATV